MARKTKTAPKGFSSTIANVVSEGARLAGEIRAHSTDTQGEAAALRTDPEAHVDYRAGLQADTGTGDPETHNPAESNHEGGAGNAAGPAADGPGTSTAALTSVTLDGVDLSPSQFEAAYPRLTGAVKDWSLALTGEFRRPVIRIASRVEGFRRAGIPHSKAATDHSADDFSPAQLELLLAEPNLIVELV